jgi:hypothetical protein
MIGETLQHLGVLEGQLNYLSVQLIGDRCRN